jgi:hypothetical protein
MEEIACTEEGKRISQSGETKIMSILSSVG